MKPFIAVEIEAPGDLFMCHSGTYGIQNERNRLLWACVVSDDAIENALRRWDIRYISGWDNLL